MTRGEAEARASTIIHAAFRALKSGEHDAAQKAAQAIVAFTWRPKSAREPAQATQVSSEPEVMVDDLEDVVRAAIADYRAGGSSPSDTLSAFVAKRVWWHQHAALPLPDTSRQVDGAGTDPRDTAWSQGQHSAGPWACYHCSFTAYTHEEARKHFGPDRWGVAACQAVTTHRERIERIIGDPKSASRVMFLLEAMARNEGGFADSLNLFLGRADVRWKMQEALSCSLPVDVTLKGSQERYIIENVCTALSARAYAAALAQPDPLTETSGRVDGGDRG